VPGPYGYTVWFICTLLEASVVVCAVKKNAFRRYLLLNTYMAVSVVADIARYNILSHYGYVSKEYLYFYYYSDFLLTILLFFALTSLYSHIFAELEVGRYIRTGAMVLLSGTALFSYGVVQQSSSRLVTHFVVEISQNLYFVGLVLTYVLWAAVLKLRETRTRLIQHCGPNRHKSAISQVCFTHNPVDAFQKLARRLISIARQLCVYQGPQHGHDDRRRGSMPRYIRHDKSPLVVDERHHIVIIAAGMFARLVIG